MNRPLKQREKNSIIFYAHVPKWIIIDRYAAVLFGMNIGRFRPYYFVLFYPCYFEVLYWWIIISDYFLWFIFFWMGNMTFPIFLLKFVIWTMSKNSKCEIRNSCKIGTNVSVVWINAEHKVFRYIQLNRVKHVIIIHF